MSDGVGVDGPAVSGIGEAVLDAAGRLERLAEVAAVEKRLAADPKARLLGYPPAVFAHGDKGDDYRAG